MGDQLVSTAKLLRRRLRRPVFILVICLLALLLPAGLLLSPGDLALGLPGEFISTGLSAATDMESAFRAMENASDSTGDLLGSPVNAAGDFSSGNAAAARVAVTIILYGDVNLNGHVEVGDAILVLRSTVGLGELLPHQCVAGDVSGDRIVNVGDAILILRHIVGLIDRFPVQKE
jgi:hypothetical protein